MTEAETRWPTWLLVAFRFAASFFAITTLYLAIGHLSSLLPFFRPIAESIQYRGLFAAYQWATKQLFGSGVVYATDAGFVAYMTTALLGASGATIIWSLIDRHRLHYRRAYAVLRIYLRYLLAAVAISYGAIKVIPAQFLPPSLVALVTPLGEFTRMRLLWHFMGTSTAYVVFTGLVEVGGGLLLLWRRTTPLGALLLAAALTNVALLNFGYEVGVQLNSTIYVLMALTLLAPDARRLAAAFLERHGTPSVAHPGMHRLGRLVKPAVIVVFIFVSFREAYVSRRDAERRPTMYGMYDVVEFARDGVPVPLGDETRWLRFIVAERGAAAIQWRAGGRVDAYAVSEDSITRVLTLKARGNEAKVLKFQYTREGNNLVQLAGDMEGHQVRAQLRAMDVTQFPLRRPRR